MKLHQIDPGSRAVEPELLVLAARLAKLAIADLRVWHYGHVPFGPRMSVERIVGLLILAVLPPVFAHRFGLGVALVVAMASIACAGALWHYWIDTGSAKTPEERARYKDTLKLAEGLGVRPRDLTFSVLQALSAQEKQWRVNARVRDAQAGFDKWEKQTAVAKATLATIRAEAAEKARKLAPKTRISAGVGRSVMTGGGWVAPADEGWVEPSSYPDLGLPLTNTNGMPMISGTFIDVTGHSYGTMD